ncbi:MAG TPA: hypothetical protein VNJ01_12080 [Bacteriovoracaceae bacterium]|nr:hypothetical protein [Bacteriovoracaceae bacterium]
MSTRKLSLSVAGIGVAFLGVFLTSYDLVFIIIGAASVIMFVAGNLVNKSLSLTQKGFAHPDPLQTALKTQLHQIAQTKYLSKVSDLGQRGWDQGKALELRWGLLKASLGKKFQPTELAYSRYLSACGETVHQILENLGLLTTNLNSMEAMDPKQPEFEKQRSLCQQLLSVNDRALTQLTELSGNVDLIGTAGSSDSLEFSLEELKRLAEQAKKYSK